MPFPAAAKVSSMHQERVSSHGMSAIFSRGCAPLQDSMGGSDCFIYVVITYCTFLIALFHEIISFINRVLFCTGNNYSTFLFSFLSSFVAVQHL